MASNTLSGSCKTCSTVSDCIDSHHVVSVNASIFDVIRQIVEHDCVLVRSLDNRITGIVTAADIAEQFQRLSEPFLVLGDIETRIRRLIGSRFTPDDLREARDPSDTGRDVETVADLGFGEYKRLLEKPERWKKLGLPLDRQVFIAQLDAVRQIRNDVMHFDPDGIADEQMDTLRKFNRSLERSLEVLDESGK